MKLFVLLVILVVYIFETAISVLNYRNRKALMPESVMDIYDPEKYQTWLSYTMANFKLGMISGIISTSLLVVLLGFNAFGWLEQFVNQLTSIVFLQPLLFLLFFYLLNLLVQLPFKYYRIFTIEATYGFNKMTKKLFWMDTLKGVILSVVLGGGLISLLDLIFRRFENDLLLLDRKSVV